MTTITEQHLEKAARAVIATCCLPGGPCYEAGLSWAQHKREPEPDTIYVWFADNGSIRKWSREPFPEGREFAATP